MEGDGSKERGMEVTNERKNKERGRKEGMKEGKKEGTVKRHGVNLTREDNRRVKMLEGKFRCTICCQRLCLCCVHNLLHVEGRKGDGIVAR